MVDESTCCEQDSDGSNEQTKFHIVQGITPKAQYPLQKQYWRFLECL